MLIRHKKTHFEGLLMLMLNPDLLIIFIFSLLVNYMLLVKYMSTSLFIVFVTKRFLPSDYITFNFELTVSILS